MGGNPELGARIERGASGLIEDRGAALEFLADFDNIVRDKARGTGDRGLRPAILEKCGKEVLESVCGALDLAIGILFFGSKNRGRGVEAETSDECAELVEKTLEFGSMDTNIIKNGGELRKVFLEKHDSGPGSLREIHAAKLVECRRRQK
jgi:hypothetical protein